MNCLQFGNTDLMERYLREELPEGELETFETHVLECDDCAEELEKFVTLKSELDRRRKHIEAPDRGQGFSPRWLWIPLAAVLVIALGLVMLLQPWSESALASLASIEAPDYQKSQHRGAVDDADKRFAVGMEHYSVTDYRGAILDLKAAASLDPNRVAIQFFLGASKLLIGRAAEGSADMGLVIAQGDTPYLEEALYLRAQASLLQGDADAAVRDLKAILELEGDWEDRARSQLEQLEALSKADG